MTNTWSDGSPSWMIAVPAAKSRTLPENANRAISSAGSAREKVPAAFDDRKLSIGLSQIGRACQMSAGATAVRPTPIPDRPPSSLQSIAFGKGVDRAPAYDVHEPGRPAYRRSMHRGTQAPAPPHRYPRGIHRERATRFHRHHGDADRDGIVRDGRRAAGHRRPGAYRHCT